MTSRAKRPSFKGKGADIFFTGEAPAAIEPEPEAVEEPEDESKLASLQASKSASKQPGKLASNRRQSRAALSDTEIAIADAALDRIAAQGRITASFRFTEDELDALDDAVTEARKKHRVKVSKQEVVRLGLAALLSDYRERGKDSVLGLYIEREKETGKKR